MSLSNDPVPVIVTDDPRVDLNVVPFYLVERSASDIIYRDYTSNSYQGGTININTIISDRRTVVSSKMLVKVKYNVEVTATGNVGADDEFTAGANSLAANIFKGPICPRYSPLMSAATNVTLNLNGKQFSEPINRYHTPLMTYCTSQEESAFDFSTFPSQQDLFQSMSEFTSVSPMAGNNVPPALIATQGSCVNGSSRVPGGYDQYLTMSRLQWLQSVATNGNATANVLTFSYEDEEIIPISPLVWGHKEVKGISGIDTLNVVINYDPVKLNRSIMAHSRRNSNDTAFRVLQAKVTIESVSGEFIYFSPRVNIEVPPVLRYKYNNIQHIPKVISGGAPAGPAYFNPITNVGPGEVTAVSDTITLQGMPKRMYVFIRRSDFLSDTLGQTQCDTYARINSFNLQLGNKPGIFAEATPQALYRMCVKNGYKESWANWYSKCGSVLCIDFAQDVPLGPLDAPGTLTKQNMQFTVKFQSLYYDRNAAGAFYYPELELNTVIVYDGMVIIKDGVVLQESSDVSALDVTSSNKIRKVHYDNLIDYAGGSYRGGSVSGILSGIRRGIGKVKDIAEKAAPYVKEYGPVVASLAAKAAPALASLLAAGYTENEIYAMMEGAKAKPKGGARVTKAQLKRKAIK